MSPAPLGDSGPLPDPGRRAKQVLGECPQELAEAMLTQYKRKETEVAQALGEAKGDYLSESRRMSETNRAIFEFRKVTIEELRKKIIEVENKESLGQD